MVNKPQNRDIIVLGASNGGIVALRNLLAEMPGDIPAALFAVQHVWSESPNRLADILARSGQLPVVPAENSSRFQHGKLYLAPPDHHLVVAEDRTWLSRGPRENRTRPSIDPLFRSAAVAYGPRTIGIILSGALDDGVAGLAAVKTCGGVACVQNPDEAMDPQMPTNAVEDVAVDFVLPVAGLARMLIRLCQEPAGQRPEVPPFLQAEVDIVRRESGEIASVESLGRLVPFSCPECGGPLWAMDGPLNRYRCHTGHALSAKSLASGLSHAAEEALWVALRTLEERERMLRRLAEKSTRRENQRTPDLYQQKAEETRDHIEQLKKLLGTSGNRGSGNPAH